MSEKMSMVADGADMIVDGYAFTREGSDFRVIDLNNPMSASFINSDDEVIETTMDDIEIAIVMDLFNKNKSFMER